MNLITPTPQPKRKLRAGDVVVSKSGLSWLMAKEYNGLRPVYLLGCISDVSKSANEWIEFWDQKFPNYTIYSYDEWELQLVPRRKEE